MRKFMNPKSITALKIKQYLQIMFRASKREMILSIGLGVLTGALIPVSLWLSKYFINELIDTFSTGQMNQMLVFGLAMIFFVGIIHEIISNISDLVNTHLSDKVSLYVTEHVLLKAIELPMIDFDDSTTYNKIQLTIQETPDRCLLLVSCLKSVLQSIIQLVGVLGLLSNLHWVVGIIPIAFIVPFIKLRQEVNKKWFNKQGDRMEKKRYSREMQNILLKNENIKELRLFGISSYIVDKTLRLLTNFNKENFDNNKKHKKINILTTMVDGIYSFAVKLWIIFESFHKGITVGGVSMYISALDTYSSSIENIMQQFSFVMEQMLYIGYICEIDEMRREEEGLRDLSEKIWKIEFRDVSFHYKNAPEDSLKHLSLVLEKNHLYALVGINGSGKTTLIKLLMKLYLPSAGDIYVNGENIAEIRGTSLRKQMSAVFQDFIKYPFSVSENISLTEIYDNENRVRDIARLIELDKDILALENGYDSILGCEWMNGINLSGGQWQKVALARCLFRDAVMYIFDEPFAWIDHIAERKVIKMMERFKKGGIGILVSHQFDAMPIMDTIFVLEHGKIIECGTHKELIEKKGVYYQLLSTESN